MFTSNFSEQKGDLAIYYEMSEGERTETRGIVEVCPKTSRWKEKSLKDITVRIREILLVQMTVPNPWIVLPWPLKPVATPTDYPGTEVHVATLAGLCCLLCVRHVLGLID